MKDKPAYRRLAAYGFGIYIVGLLVAIVTDSSFIGFAAVNLLVAAIAALLVLTIKWGEWAALIISVLLWMFTFWSVFVLQGIGSMFDFTFGLLLTVGKLVALIGSIAAIANRSAPKLEFGSLGRGILRGGLALMAMLIVLSAILTVTGRESVSDAKQAGSLYVDMKDIEFSPDKIDLASGQTKVLVHNSDRTGHTFTIDKLKIDEVITPGSETLVTIDAKPGSYKLSCEFHDTMNGKVIVE